ncbi:MAG: HAD family phosphatase [Candidatus Rokubacteria bacterium]|nr:HAD family phosphatase [Candidatus Rokubacteria bacterium]
MGFELLVLDLDGVILDSAMRIDPALDAGLKRAMARGLRVTLATGRMPSASRPYWERLGISMPVILYNGALVQDPASRAILYARELPRGILWETYPIYTHAPVDPLYYKDDTLYCLERTHPVLTYCGEEALDAVEIADRETFLRENSFVKCLFIGHPAVLPVLREELAPRVGASRLVVSHTNYLELLPAGVSKGEALVVLADHLGIPLERVIAVGDEENDLEMIQTAGFGIAMPHSPPHVRAAAARVVLGGAAGLEALLAEISPEHFQPEVKWPS